MKVGDKASVSPQITGLDTWVEGVIIKIRNNPFLGTEIAIQDEHGHIYFDAAEYFKKIELSH
jgi:hypothetical protein